jgi:hypothetical protein
MSHGGKRSGSGRKPGAATRANEEARAKAAEGGEMPLDYMLRVMREAETDIERRDDMAKAAAPYCHSKLAQTDVNAQLNVDGSITFTWQPPQES